MRERGAGGGEPGAGRAKVRLGVLRVGFCARGAECFLARGLEGFAFGVFLVGGVRCWSGPSCDFASRLKIARAVQNPSIVRGSCCARGLFYWLDQCIVRAELRRFCIKRPIDGGMITYCAQLSTGIVRSWFSPMKDFSSSRRATVAQSGFITFGQACFGEHRGRRELLILDVNDRLRPAIPDGVRMTIYYPATGFNKFFWPAPGIN